MGDENPHGGFQGHGHGHEHYERYHDRFGNRAGWHNHTHHRSVHSKTKKIAFFMFVIFGLCLIVLGFVLSHLKKEPQTQSSQSVEVTVV